MVYSNKQTNFSNAVHDKLMKLNFYEKLFDNNNIKVIDTTVTKPGYNKEAQILDQKYGVDYRIIAKIKLLGNIPVTIQERFRDIKYKHYQSLTIRVETKTGLASELSKINADFFIYGYVDIINGIIKPNQIVVINVALIKQAIIMDKLQYTIHKNYDGSGFIDIRFSDLSKINAIIKTETFKV